MQYFYWKSHLHTFIGVVFLKKWNARDSSWFCIFKFLIVPHYRTIGVWQEFQELFIIFIYPFPIMVIISGWRAVGCVRDAPVTRGSAPSSARAPHVITRWCAPPPPLCCVARAELSDWVLCSVHGGWPLVTQVQSEHQSRVMTITNIPASATLCIWGSPWESQRRLG